MKTAESIEEQEERKAARGDGDGLPSQASEQPSVKRKLKKLDATRIAPWQFKKGVSGNPGGRPKRDWAADIARAVFENNAEALYKAFSKALRRGNAYAFKELADRAYGKLKDHVEYDLSPYRDESDEAIRARIAELERELGITRQSGPEPPSTPTSKPN
jgi:hypothetical protein